MSNRKITIGDIIKRSNSINSTIESVDSVRIYNIIESYDESKNVNSVDLHRNIRFYIDCLCNVENARDYYYEPLSLMEKFNDSNDELSKYILQEYTSRIIPYIQDLDDVRNSVEIHEGLTQEQVDSVLESIEINHVADRILANHRAISKRFMIENEFSRLSDNNLKYVIDNCSSLIDTYKSPMYQKISVTLEEAFYNLAKNKGGKFDDYKVSRYCLEYFLVNSSFNEEDRNNIIRVFTESPVISEECASKICIMLNKPENMEEPYSIARVIDKYLATGTKSIEDLLDLSRRLGYSTSTLDLCTNFDLFIIMIWDLYKADFDERVLDCIRELIDQNNKVCMISKEDTYKIIKCINSAIDKIKYYGMVNSNLSSKVNTMINTCLIPLMNSLKADMKLEYPKENIDTMDYVNNESVESIPLNEFKVFKFHNLIRGAFNLNKVLKAKEKKLYNLIKGKYQKFLKKGNNILFGESAETISNDILTYIGEDYKADIFISQYVFDEYYVEEVSDLLNSVCKEFNTGLKDDTFRAYYTIDENIAELRIKESTKVELSEEQIEECRTTIDPSMELYFDLLTEMDSLYDIYKDIPFNKMNALLKNPVFNEEFDMDHYNAVIECAKYLDIDRRVLKLFAEKYATYNFNKAIKENSDDLVMYYKERHITESVENIEYIDNLPIEIQLEAATYMIALLEKASPDKIKRVNDKGEKVPDLCPKCGSKIGIFLHGEPVWLCDACKKYFGTLPFKESSSELLDFLEATVKPLVGGKAVEQRMKDEDDEDFDDEDFDDEEDDEESSDKKKEKSDDKKIDDITKGLKPSEEKKASKGINITNIKLGLKGLATKAKEFSTKEKEASRNLDNASRSFINSIRNAMTNNRREAIIKGSVIPSFSRCIKAAILFATVGKFISLPAALISAFGSLGVSSKLNKREKLLLLDEIETELEVVEKELNIADNNGNMKQYRNLLGYKKNLQRQYQRIKYGLRVGKDITPYSSSAGVRKNFS